MANVVTIKGFDKVMANLNAEIAMIKHRSMRGLLMGAAIVRKDMEKTVPLTPVDYGNLKSSFFTVNSKSIASGKGSKFEGPKASKMGMDHSSMISEMQGMAKAKSMGGKGVVYLGYTANYALKTHELLGMSDIPRWRYGPGPGKKRWYTPRAGAGPKWFEYSFKRNSNKILEIIRLNAQIKR